MSEIKHSPLPWKSETPDGINGVIVDSDGEIVVMVVDNPDHGTEDTRDIPDLNHALVINACNNYYHLQQQNAALVEALKFIANTGGNLPDESLESRTGANDAVARGLMVTAARAVARQALAATSKEGQ